MNAMRSQTIGAPAPHRRHSQKLPKNMVKWTNVSWAGMHSQTEPIKRQSKRQYRKLRPKPTIMDGRESINSWTLYDECTAWFQRRTFPVTSSCWPVKLYGSVFTLQTPRIKRQFITQFRSSVAVIQQQVFTSPFKLQHCGCRLRSTRCTTGLGEGVALYLDYTAVVNNFPAKAWQFREILLFGVMRRSQSCAL